jgi:hypothetical protein
MAFVFFKKEQAVAQLSAATLISTFREVLGNEGLINANEMCPPLSSPNCQIQFFAPSEPRIEPTELTKGIRPSHQRTASSHAPTMMTIIVDEAQEVVGSQRTARFGWHPPNSTTLAYWHSAIAWHNVTIGIAKHIGARMRGLVVAYAPILSL